MIVNFVLMGIHTFLRYLKCLIETHGLDCKMNSVIIIVSVIH